MNVEGPEGYDWQSCIAGVGIIEFFQLDNQDRFIESINQFLNEGEQIHGFNPRETHPRVPFQLTDLRREVSLPDHSNTLFESVNLQIAVDTNTLARVLLYGNIDVERFKEERAKRYEDSTEGLQLQNHGLEALRDAQSELSQFLREDVGAGFFTECVEPWADGRRTKMQHPSFWFYDFSEAGPSSLTDFQQQRNEETFFIGLGKKDQPEQGFTPYANERCVVHGEGRQYWVTQLGSFPFRYFLIRFQTDARTEPIFDWESLKPDFGIPNDVTRGYIPLARSYAHLFWSIATYDELAAYAPETRLPSKDVQDLLNGMSDREKADLLDNLHEEGRQLDEFWHQRQEQFSSIRTMRAEQSGYADQEGAVIEPLVDAAEDIEALCEDQVTRFRDRYQRLTDRVQTHIQTNVGIVGKKLSIVLFVLTVANLLAQLPAILSYQHSEAILAVFGVLGVLALVIIFSDSVLVNRNFS